MSRMFWLNLELIGRFKSLVSVSGYTVTGVLGKFMGWCAGAAVFVGRK